MTPRKLSIYWGAYCALFTALDLPPKAVQIILLEMDPSDYAIAGKLISDQDESLSEKKK